ncbi:MAG TPA: alpha/beta hydrolase [Thermoanaerobaculia bacterium]|nr:alpha/beta hydrolase [Thermoanaerobaculia bacterium]
MKLSDILLSPKGLAPCDASPEAFLECVREAAGARGLVAELEGNGDPREPARIHAVFASPGAPASRATLLFLHGKGGCGAEWRRDAERALGLGYNVLVPDLRGHAPSTGTRITYGILESVDMALLVADAARRFRLDPARVGVDACSAGCLTALQYAARSGAAALWLQAPFAALPEMALRYGSRVTGLPPAVLALPMRVALFCIERGDGLLLPDDLDPIAAARRITCPTTVVHGESDTLVPAAFSDPLLAALTGEKELWRVPRCGHCHHPDEPQAILKREYVARWTAFFGRHLPPRVGYHRAP